MGEAYRRSAGRTPRMPSALAAFQITSALDPPCARLWRSFGLREDQNMLALCLALGFSGKDDGGSSPTIGMRLKLNQL